jgi:hypothetical protein
MKPQSNRCGGAPIDAMPRRIETGRRTTADRWPTRWADTSPRAGKAAPTWENNDK